MRYISYYINIEDNSLLIKFGNKLYVHNYVLSILLGVLNESLSIKQNINTNTKSELDTEHLNNKKNK